MPDAHRDSGNIKLDAELIRYRSAVFGEWEMPMAGLKVLGEWTDPRAPSGDDLFLAFGAGPQKVFEASAYAAGYVDFMVELGTLLGAKLIATLHGSADSKSRVLWPDELAGKELFEFYREPPQGLWGKLKAMFGLAPMRHRLSREVAAFLEGKAG